MDKREWDALPADTRKTIAEMWIEAFEPARGHSAQCTCDSCVVTWKRDGQQYSRRLPPVYDRTPQELRGDLVTAVQRVNEVDRQQAERYRADYQTRRELAKQVAGDAEQWTPTVAPVQEDVGDFLAREHVALGQEQFTKIELQVCVLATALLLCGATAAVIAGWTLVAIAVTIATLTAVIVTVGAVREPDKRTTTRLEASAAATRALGRSK